jgi:hypothetical protein
MSTIFRDLRLDDIKEFRFQGRSHRWVEFRNVVLKPSQDAASASGIEKAAASPELPWGDWNSNWSLRIRTDKNVWASDELPEFAVDLRRREVPDGGIAIHRTLHNWILEVNGRRFRLGVFTTSREKNFLFQESETTANAFETFHFHRDESGLHIRTGENRGWINSYTLDPIGEDRKVMSNPGPESHFQLTPGKHLVRIAYPRIENLAPEDDPENYLVLSNSVEMEIQEKPSGGA